MRYVTKGKTTRQAMGMACSDSYLDHALAGPLHSDLFSIQAFLLTGTDPCNARRLLKPGIRKPNLGNPTCSTEFTFDM